MEQSPHSGSNRVAAALNLHPRSNQTQRGVLLCFVTVCVSHTPCELTLTLGARQGKGLVPEEGKLGCGTTGFRFGVGTTVPGLQHEVLVTRI